MSLADFRKQSYLARTDPVLIVLVSILLVFGLAMIYSASVVIAFQRYHNSAYYVSRQILFLLLGVVVWVITSTIRYSIWKQYARWLLLLTFILLIMVLVFSAGRISGAHRWISFGSFLFQPSEFAKLTLILYLAALLERKKEVITKFQYGFLPIAALIASVALLVMLEPDLGTTGIIVGIAATMYILAGAPWKHIGIGVAGAVAAVAGLIAVAPYRLARLTVFLNPSADPSGTGYHLKNALIAIGSGGLFGLGFGQSRQKYLYLPSAHTDSIIAVAGEELGFIRLMVILAIYLLFCLRAIKIARGAPDLFGRYVASGIAAWFFFQFFVNLAANLALLPLTGVPLPLISYGGSALLASMAAIGILSNISRHVVE